MNPHLQRPQPSDSRRLWRRPAGSIPAASTIFLCDFNQLQTAELACTPAALHWDRLELKQRAWLILRNDEREGFARLAESYVEHTPGVPSVTKMGFSPDFADTSKHERRRGPWLAAFQAFLAG